MGNLRPLLCAITLLAMLCSCQRSPMQDEDEVKADGHRLAVLQLLRNEINANYGFHNGVPRINLGPCGRFARDFRERWNNRFEDKCDIAFVMSKTTGECHHVLVRLPDGRFYDGGNGVVTGGTLMLMWADARMDVMTEFDPRLLDERSYGLARAYPMCPNYSDSLTAGIIEKHLNMLPAGTR